MDIERIKTLLQRFYDGESTSDEEHELMAFFASATDLPKEMEADKMLFASMSKAKDMDEDIPEGLEARLLSKVDEWESSSDNSFEKPIRGRTRALEERLNISPSRSEGRTVLCSTEELHPLIEEFDRNNGESKVIPLFRSPIFRNIAAMLAIIAGIGIFYTVNKDSDNEIAYLENKDTFNDPDEAYAKSMKALELFSKTIDKGEADVSKVNAKTSRMMSKLDRFIQ